MHLKSEWSISLHGGSPWTLRVQVISFTSKFFVYILKCLAHLPKTSNNYALKIWVTNIISWRQPLSIEHRESKWSALRWVQKFCFILRSLALLHTTSSVPCTQNLIRINSICTVDIRVQTRCFIVKNIMVNLEQCGSSSPNQQCTAHSKSRVSCQKGPTRHVICMAGRALLAGYPRNVVNECQSFGRVQDLQYGCGDLT